MPSMDKRLLQLLCLIATPFSWWVAHDAFTHPRKYVIHDLLGWPKYLNYYVFVITAVLTVYSLVIIWNWFAKPTEYPRT